MATQYTGSGLCSYCQRYIGTSYSKMDCSTFVRASVKGYCGKDITRSCKTQLNFFRTKYPSMVMECNGQNINSNYCKAGDLIYKMNYNGSSNHVMIADGSGGVYESSNGAMQVRHKTPYAWAYKSVTAVVRIFGNTSSPASQSTGTATTGSGAGRSDVIASEGVNTSSGSTSAQTETNPDYSYLLAGGLNLNSVDTYKSTVENYLSKIKGTSLSSNLLESVTLENTNVGYVIDLKNNTSMKFFIPEHNDSVTAKYDYVSIPGRSSDIPSYDSTESRELSFDIEMFAGIGFYKGNNPVDSMYRDIAFLQSLVYPIYSSKIVTPPPMVLVYLGPGTIIKGLITTVNPSYKKPIHVDGRFMRATVSVTVHQTSDYPADLTDVRNKTFSSY